MKSAYLDCFSGVSGDMFLGALVDAGLSFKELKKILQTLPLKGYRLEAKREERKHICGKRILVKLEGNNQEQRDLKTIRRIIQQSGLSAAVKEKSTDIFEELASVEGRIHDRRPEEVHFHEIGAVDSIIDIVGTVYGIERLAIGSLFVSSIPLGSGFIRSAHGRIPIPAPATVALLKGVPVFDSGVSHEMVTPTGAALVKGLACSFGPMPPMVIQKIGYGVGNSDLSDRPNLLRILIGSDQTKEMVETVAMLETNLDDSSPEWLGYLMERLFDAGALDVVFCPVHMKKSRPGVQVQVMSQPSQRDSLMGILFRESGTLGVRFRYSQRKILNRAMAEVDSPWGKIKVKKVMSKDGSQFLLPEYEACREIALKNNCPLREIFFWVTGLNKKK